MAELSKAIFARNLRSYMEATRINQKELAAIIGVSAPTLNEWLQAKKYPRIDKIEKLASHFKITKADLIEEKAGPSPIRHSQEEIGLLIKNKRLEKGLSQAQLGEIIGFSANTIARWEKGNLSKMNYTTTSLLAKALAISPLNLLGFSSEEVNKAERRKQQQAIWRKHFANVDFTEAEFAEIIAYAEEILSKRN